MCGDRLRVRVRIRVRVSARARMREGGLRHVVVYLSTRVTVGGVVVELQDPGLRARCTDKG